MGTPTARMGAPTTRPIDRPTRLLQVLLVGAVLESFVHYLDNTVRFDDYGSDSPPAISSWIARWMIPLFWVLFTGAAVVGYRRLRAGHLPQAAAWLGAYSASGLVSLLHFVDISPSDLSAFQDTFVFLDVAFGIAVLAYALWLAIRSPIAASPRTA